MRLPPGACISSISSAPSPQATSSPSLAEARKTAPGWPLPCAARARYTFSTPPAYSVKAQGPGVEAAGLVGNLLRRPRPVYPAHLFFEHGLAAGKALILLDGRNLPLR